MNRDEALRQALAARYRVEREIAVGGMAAVYLVVDLKHQRNVALKIMHDTVMEQGAERFLREIGVTARFSHPHILPLLDSGEALGMPYYVMPFVDGETLKDRLARESRLSVADALPIAIEVADALAYAHAHGVIHRDIKPANILLSGKHALVADFGVAKAMSSSTAITEDQTRVGLIVGTLAYMSPEQALGEPTIDSRSDIYSLAVVLYEMLVGEPIFAGATPREMLAKRFLPTPPSARAVRPEISVEIDRVLGRALASNPDDRYASAGEFEDALTAAWRSGAHSTGSIRIVGETAATPSLAVLPFENLSGDANNEYLSDGIAEEILTALSRRRTIRVCARQSSFAMRASQDDVRTVAQRLGVQNVVTGSVRRAADRLRVSVQLINARDGFLRWSDRYDRQVSDVFAIQEEIGASVANALHTTLMPSTLPTVDPAPPPGLEVYETFLRGRFFGNRRTAEGMRRAIECFQDALKLDPSYAPALAGIADAWVTQAIYGQAAPAHAMREARTAAEHALQLDAGLADARVALATVSAAHDWDRAAAESMFRHALGINPMLPAAYQGLAIMTLIPARRVDEAIRAMQRALMLDPLSPLLRVTLCSVLLYARRYDRAVEAAQTVLDLDVNFAPAHYFLSQALTQLGRDAQALEHAELAVTHSNGSSETVALLGHALGRAGEVVRADEIARGLDRRALTEYVSPTHRAQVRLGLGQNTRALELLEEACEARASDLVWLGVRPLYDPLRGEPRFIALLERMHLA